MISFYQFIKEAFHATYKSLYPRVPETTVIKNPSRNDMLRMIHQSDHKSIRGILTHHDNGEQHAYFWNADHGLHADIQDKLHDEGLPGKHMAVTVSRTPKSSVPTVKSFHSPDELKTHSFASRFDGYHHEKG